MLVLALIIAVPFAYLLGSISPSYLAGRMLKGIDLREHGSGNLGGSNAQRLLGKKAGITVLLLDVLKGFLAVWIGREVATCFGLTGEMAIIVQVFSGISVILGHVYPCFLGFKGGKGVAVGLGVFLFLAPGAVAGAFLVWAVTVVCTRYISLGSILASISLPLFVWGKRYFACCATYSDSCWVFALAVAVAVMVVFKHIANIQRLLAGCENRFSWGKSGPDD